GKDTLVVAGTGAGKSLTFAMPHFALGNAITWLLVPLNYIMEQQVETFNKWGIPSIGMNSNTQWGEAKKDILAGKYQIIISSPESFLDTDKLRNLVSLDKLKDWKHFVVVDEAHVIHTWSLDFRKCYGYVGNLRSILFDIPFSAVTATATAEIRTAIINSLHLGTQQPLSVQNIGNFHSNIEYSIYKMTGGAASYSEICKVLPPPEEIRQTLVFVDVIHDAHAVAHALREGLGWTGDLAQRIRPYHSNRAEQGKKDTTDAFKNSQCRVIVSTEALTMGCDFSDVEIVVQFGAPDSLVTHVQPIVRGARTQSLWSRGIMMVTAHQHALAVKTSAGEEIEEEQKVMDQNVARFISTRGCLTKILDEVFDNPP
ncbi:P-loop containing nucleoside triphosphate hydrolase protein, partial [Ceratobasidium sp. AG-I]